MTSVNLQIREALIRNVVYLAFGNEYVFGSTFHASQSAISCGHIGSRVRSDHFRVTDTAHAVANLARPCRISSRNQRGKSQEQADTAQTPKDVIHRCSPFDWAFHLASRPRPI